MEEEFFQQGDQEKAAGLPVSPLSDRAWPHQGVTKSQLGFFEFVAFPLYHNFSHVFVECKRGPLRSFTRAYRAWKSGEADVLVARELAATATGPGAVGAAAGGSEMTPVAEERKS